MSYIGLDYQDISIGDEFVVCMPGFGGSKWSRPLAVSKVTKTQFRLEPVVPVEEQTDDTPRSMAICQRFRRSNGVRIGDGDRWRGWRAERATEEKLEEIAEIVADQTKAENEAAAKARAEEQALREKYGCEGITCEKTQDKYLKPLRKIAEQGNKSVAFAMQEFEGKEITPESIKWFAARTARQMENGNIQIALEMEEKAKELIGGLVTLLTAFQNGTRYELEGWQKPFTEITSAAELAKAYLKFVLDREMDQYFRYSNDRRGQEDDRDIARRNIIAELREICDQQYRYQRIKAVKEEGDDDE